LIVHDFRNIFANISTLKLLRKLKKYTVDVNRAFPSDFTCGEKLTPCYQFSGISLYTVYFRYYKCTYPYQRAKYNTGCMYTWESAILERW